MASERIIEATSLRSQSTQSTPSHATVVYKIARTHAHKLYNDDGTCRRHQHFGGSDAAIMTPSGSLAQDVWGNLTFDVLHIVQCVAGSMDRCPRQRHLGAHDVPRGFRRRRPSKN